MNTATVNQTLPAYPVVLVAAEDVLNLQGAMNLLMDSGLAAEGKPIAEVLHKLGNIMGRWEDLVFDENLNIREAAPAAASESIPDELRQVGVLLRTQDNRATDAPLFIVQQKITYVSEDGYNDCRYEWRETQSGDHALADEKKAKALDAKFRETHIEPKGWKRYAVHDVWEFVTACFTKEGCENYLASNGHNLNEPRIYAEGSYRNQEFRAVRNWLMTLAPAVKKSAVLQDTSI